MIEARGFIKMNEKKREKETYVKAALLRDGHRSFRTPLFAKTT